MQRIVKNYKTIDLSFGVCLLFTRIGHIVEHFKAVSDQGILVPSAGYIIARLCPEVVFLTVTVTAQSRQTVTILLRNGKGHSVYTVKAHDDSTR